MASVNSSVKSGVVLVGMPGAGKSTLGVQLAKALARPFVDTDLLIQQRCGRTLQQLVDQDGYLFLREQEERVLLEGDFDNHVVATGGSVVYSEAGMRRLRGCGLVVFLDVPLESLRARVHDYDQRGIARRPGQSFESLFTERRALYQRYADVTLDCGELDAGAALQALVRVCRDAFRTDPQR